jgi:hypothetical protein
VVVHVPRTPRFDEEAERHRLRFTCDDCGFFDPSTARCRHRWPTELHRLSRYQAAAAGEADQVVFCKEFELR